MYVQEVYKELAKLIEDIDHGAPVDLKEKKEILESALEIVWMYSDLI